MSARQSPSAQQGPHRLERLLGYESPVATMLLTAFQYFTVSLSFIVTLLPVFAFHALVGWQPTHLAIWLNALSLLPVFASVYALLAAGDRLLLLGADARAARLFWASFAQAIRSLWWVSAGAAAVALVLGYDIGLAGDSDAVFLLAVMVSLVAVALMIALACVALTGVRSPRALLVASVRAIAYRPHIPLSWLLLAAIAGLATTIPLFGAVAALFLPAATAVAVHICNRGLGFNRTSPTADTHEHDPARLRNRGTEPNA